jgi:hypothetical protein
MKQHNYQFGVEATALVAPMPKRMLIVTLLEGYCRLPGTKPYVILRRSQPTTNPQHPSSPCDLNGGQWPPWCPTPSANADNSHPEYWQFVVYRGARVGAPWQPWEYGGGHGWCGTVLLALASFYLAKTHITTHNNQLLRPDWWCGEDDISAKYEVTSSRNLSTASQHIDAAYTPTSFN